jgi:hypothetical protein
MRANDRTSSSRSEGDFFAAVAAARHAEPRIAQGEQLARTPHQARRWPDQQVNIGDRFYYLTVVELGLATARRGGIALP